MNLYLLVSALNTKERYMKLPIFSEGMAFLMTSDGTELTLPMSECYKYCKARLSDGENTDDSDAEGK
jgi:hypothetical protein